MAKKRSAALARIAETIEITSADGSKLAVPVSAEANSVLNKIMASQMRAVMQKTIEYCMGLDHMTPKELKEFTEAARNLAEFSGEVYKAGEEINEPGEKRVDPISSETIDYSKIKTQPKPGKQSGIEEKKESQEETEGMAEQSDKA